MDSVVVQKLQALANLQKIDSRLDRIRQVRGGLPEEVRDLEDEIEGLSTRLQRLDDEIEKQNKEIVNRKALIDNARDMIKKYDAQLTEVRNNREYEAITKEIELANLDILTSERKIKQHQDIIREREKQIEDVRKVFNERSNDLEEKNKELDALVKETEIEESALLQQSAIAARDIDGRLIRAYTKIRQNMRNGLAVVTMDRGACGGCFAVIPPQRQYEIRQQKRIIVCENCGRILVDESMFTETATQMVAAEA